MSIFDRENFNAAEKEHLEPKEPKLSSIRCDECLEYIPEWGGYYELAGKIICSNCIEGAREQYAEPD